MMRSGDILVIVEVRYRGPGSRISAAESVSLAKQQKIIRATEFFLVRNGRYAGLDLRFDVVCIDRSASGDTKLQWLRDAFRPSW